MAFFGFVLDLEAISSCVYWAERERERSRYRPKAGARGIPPRSVRISSKEYEADIDERGVQALFALVHNISI